MTVRRANVLLLIVIGLLLLSLFGPVIHHFRVAALRKQTDDQLRHITHALHSFHDEHSVFPPVFDRFIVKGSQAALLPRAASFHVYLLPYLGQVEVFASFKSEHDGIVDARIPAYISDLDESKENCAGTQCFAANLRAFAAKGVATHPRDNMPALAPIEPGGQSIRVLVRGTSSQIALAPKLAKCASGGSRYAADPTSRYAAFFGQNAAHTTAQFSDAAATFQWAPRGNECLITPLMAQSYLPGPLPVAMADGTVRRIPGDINPGLWNRLMSPSME